MSVRARIESVFAEVAREQQRRLPPLSDDLPLLESGLNSYSLALVVARLEDALGFDPFETVDTFPATFAEFVALYTHRQGGP